MSGVTSPIEKSPDVPDREICRKFHLDTPHQQKDVYVYYELPFQISHSEYPLYMSNSQSVRCFWFQNLQDLWHRRSPRTLVEAGSCIRTTMGNHGGSALFRSKLLLTIYLMFGFRWPIRYGIVPAIIYVYIYIHIHHEKYLEKQGIGPYIKIDVNVFQDGCILGCPPCQ